MKLIKKLFPYLMLLVLSACGVGEGVDLNETKESPSTLSSSLPPVEIPLAHQCDLSAYSNLNQERVDFSYSVQPAITVRRRYIDLFRSVTWNSQQQKENQIKNLLRVNRLNPSRIQVNLEQPICTARTFDLGDKLEVGVLPIQELLEAECPELKSHNIFSDVDTTLEQQLADKIRRDFTEEEYAEFSQSFYGNAIDLLVENSSYLGFTFDLKVSEGTIVPEFNERQKQAIESQGWLAALNHSEGDLCIE